MRVFSKILSLINLNESSIENLSGFTKELSQIKIILDNTINCRDKSTLILLDDIYKKTSLKNRISLFSGTLIYITKININQSNKFLLENNLEYSNKRQKIMVDFNNLHYQNFNQTVKNTVFLFTISNDFKDKITSFIQDYQDAIQFSELYSEIVKKEEKFSIFNTYQLRILINISLEIAEDNFLKNSIYIARQNGLNNELFVKALDLLNNMNKKTKVPLNHLVINNYFKFINNNVSSFKNLNEINVLYKIINDLNNLN